MHMVFLDAVRDLTQSGGYAWGATALVHMYDNLKDMSKSTARQLAGYFTLLQVVGYRNRGKVGSSNFKSSASLAKVASDITSQTAALQNSST